MTKTIAEIRHVKFITNTSLGNQNHEENQTMNIYLSLYFYINFGKILYSKSIYQKLHYYLAFRKNSYL